MPALLLNFLHFNDVRQVHGKNDFAEVPTNLNTNLKIILLGHQNNYVERLNVCDNAAKSFNFLTTSLNVLYIIMI